MPFAAFLSPPHFVYSPEHVTKSMVGLAPDPVKHEGGRFSVQPVSKTKKRSLQLTGATVRAFFRMQLSIPLYVDQRFT